MLQFREEVPQVFDPEAGQPFLRPTSQQTPGNMHPQVFAEVKVGSASQQ